MIRTILISRILRCARRLDRLPRPLMVRRSRGPISLPWAERTTVECREQHGRPPQCRNGRPALSRKRWHRLCRPHHRRHRETWPLRSKRFGAWLRQQYYERTWDAPSPAALNAALNVLEAQAQFDGPQRQVFVRLAEHDGLLYLDLADEFWRCVEIGANGWRIAEDPLVRFRRSAGMQPLPLPVRGGSIG